MKNKKYWISGAILIIIICLTMYTLLKDFKVSDIVNTILSVNPIYIILCIVMVFLYLWFEGLGLKVVLKTIGTKISGKKGFVYANVDLYFSLITPSSTGGQPVMAYYMNRDSIPIPQSTIAILFNTMTFKVVLMVLSAGVLIFMPDVVLGNGVLVTVLFFVGFGMQILMSALCFMSMFSQTVVRKISVSFITFLGKIRILKKPQKTLESLEKSLGDYAQCAEFLKNSLSMIPKVFVVNFIQRVCLFTVGYFVYRSFGQNALNYFEVVGIQTAIAMSANFLPIPGAAGITEAVFALLYSSIYPNEQLLVSALLLTRIFDYYFSLVLSGAVTLANHVKLTKKAKKEGCIK
ncbi:MAG: flippase-like domain-containing protein [Clostridia bacterium]|nr:flippase-like domain-containing protein [Clostridia bacterium]